MKHVTWYNLSVKQDNLVQKNLYHFVSELSAKLATLQNKQVRFITKKVFLCLATKYILLPTQTKTLHRSLINIILTSFRCQEV
jgi:hypothetical protein